MDDSNEPMITVKKADGTTERITLTQFKARQAQPKAPSPTAVASVQSISKPPEPTVKPPSSVPVLSPTPKPQPTNVAPIFQKPIKPTVRLSQPSQKLATPKLDKNDFASPFDDEIQEIKGGSPKLSATHGREVQEIISKLSFQVPEAYHNRLSSIIQLRLKDIRSEGDTRLLVFQSIKDGGLGLTEEQGEELLRSIKYFGRTDSSSKLGERSPVISSRAGLPMIEPEMEPATTTPFNAFVRKPNSLSFRASPEGATRNLRAGIKPVEISPPPRRGRNDNVLPVSSSAGFSKPAMNDIISKPKEMGPLEEILYFTLVDFRRLSDSSTEAASRLWQKFINLKEESILLYFEAVKNWHLSPLYSDYLKAMSAAIAKKQKLASIIGDKSQIQLAEIQALIEMEKRLE